ncbi:REP-associated tyrosine transposase [Pontiella desulfatans]|uniref:REP-associated tyrosine transposase n=1 Tax=Pontiella desulfatans TaxID=2750659 RepID=UPI00109CB6A7|nr:transposase [Pontiella desulfatans]
MKPQPRKPRRLENLFHSYDSPIYFITFSTFDRKPILATEPAHQKFQAFAEQARDHGAAFGRYVIMPDHIHVFIRISRQNKLGTTVRLLKRSISAAIENPQPHWQPGFFDHVLRHSESYAEKWNYVLQNPARAKLVEKPEDWPYQGEATPLFF